MEPEPPLEHGSAVQEVELRMDHDLVVMGAWTVKLVGEMDGLGNGGAREILGLTNPWGTRSSLGVACCSHTVAGSPPRSLSMFFCQ